MVRFAKVTYSDLNSKQKEIFNFQKVSGVLADYGYATLKLSDDWNGADFLAVHKDGTTTLRVQLKSRLNFQTKYEKRDLWICFRNKGRVFLFPHDEVLKKLLSRIENTVSWENGGYSWGNPPKWAEKLLEPYLLGKEAEPA